MDPIKPEPVDETTPPDVGTTTAWYATPAEAADFARQTGFALLPTFMSWDKGKWSKRPRPGCLWKEESTSDPDAVRALWEKHAPGDDPEMRSMISIHCGKSGVFVFDEDDPDRVKGDFRRVMDEAEQLTLVRRSVSRGTRHVYFRQPEGELKVLDSVFEGGEVKGDGYVAVSKAPPVAGVLPMPAPAWVLDLCHLGRPMVTSRSGSSRPALRIENLEAWIAVHSPEPVVSDPDAFMRKRIEEFWSRLSKEHRRMAALYSARAMFAEAMGGMYTLADAYESLLDAYREARKRDGTWSHNRETDFQLMWVGLIDGYDSDGFIGRGGANIHDDIEAVRERLGWTDGKFDDLMTDEALAEILDEWSWRPEDWTPGDRSTSDASILAMAVAPDSREETHVALSETSTDAMVERPSEAVESPERDVEPASELTDALLGVVAPPEETVRVAEPEPEEHEHAEIPVPVVAGGSGRGARIVLDEAAYFGPHGEFVKALVPHTEADPAAMLITTMAYYGAWLAKSRKVERGGGKHSPSIQCVIIGQSSIARKGTSHAMVRRAWEPVMKAPGPDDDDAGPVYPLGVKPLKQIGGVASGEALIDLMSMPGTRAVMLEEEFVQMLRRIGRQGSTLGTVMRSVFDQKTLETHSRGSGTVTADGDLYSLSFIGHATDDELLSTITAAEIYGGSANRMLWVRAHPQRPLPFEKPAPESIYETYRKHLGVTRSGVPGKLELHISAEAEGLWEEIYRRESEPAYGLYGAVQARGPINVLRLALNYASSVGETSIGVESLLAADAVWRYCQETAWSLFGIRSGDPAVDSLVEALVEVYEDINQDPWLTTSELRSRFSTRATTTVDKAKTTGLIQRIRIPAMDSEGRPKRGRPAEYLMLSDLAVEKLKLPRRKEHPRSIVDFDF